MGSSLPNKKDVSLKKYVELTKELEEALQCPVCFNITGDTILCIEGHSICKECRNKLQECPLCKKSFSADYSLILKDVARSYSDMKTFTDSTEEFWDSCDDEVQLRQLIKSLLSKLASFMHLVSDTFSYLDGYFQSSQLSQREAEIKISTLKTDLNCTRLLLMKTIGQSDSLKSIHKLFQDLGKVLKCSKCSTISDETSQCVRGHSCCLKCTGLSVSCSLCSSSIIPRTSYVLKTVVTIFSSMNSLIESEEDLSLSSSNLQNDMRRKILNELGKLLPHYLNQIGDIFENLQFMIKFPRQQKREAQTQMDASVRISNSIAKLMGEIKEKLDEIRTLNNNSP